MVKHNVFIQYITILMIITSTSFAISCDSTGSKKSNDNLFYLVLGKPHVQINGEPQVIINVKAGDSIQAAINAAEPGNTISIASGTYDEVIDINKRITLVGAGSGDAGTVLTKNTVVPNPAPYPLQVDGITYSYNPVVIISASGIAGNPILLKDIKIEPRQDKIGAARQVPAILLRPGTGASYIASYSYVELNNVRVIGTHSFGTPESGVRIDGSTSLYHFIVRNSEFSNMGYGMIFHNNAVNPGMVQYVEVNDTTFNNNSIKGFYAEKLSDATFNNVIAANNGITNLSPSWAIANNAGIDINLTYGAYQNLVFNNLTVTGNGIATAAIINPNYGAGLTVKARGTGNDSSLSTNPATLTGVTINGGTFTGNVTGIRFGEPGKNNTSPTNISVSGAVITGNTFDLANLLSGVTIPNYNVVDPQIKYITLTPSMLVLPAAFQTFGFGWDWDMDSPEGSTEVGGAPDPGFNFGNSAFYSDVLGGSSSTRKYSALRIYPQAAFNMADIKLEDIQSISYWTKQKIADGIQNSIADKDRTWQLKIYTVNPNATPAIWYKIRLSTALQYYADTAWKNNSTDDTSLNFTDSRSIHDFTKGPSSNSSNFISYTTIGNGHGTLTDMNMGYGSDSILFIDIVAGTSTPSPAIQSYLDGIVIKLMNGKKAVIDLAAN